MVVVIIRVSGVQQRLQSHTSAADNQCAEHGTNCAPFSGAGVPVL